MGGFFPLDSFSYGREWPVLLAIVFAIAASLEIWGRIQSATYNREVYPDQSSYAGMLWMEDVPPRYPVIYMPVCALLLVILTIRVDRGLVTAACITALLNGISILHK